MPPKVEAVIHRTNSFVADPPLVENGLFFEGKRLTTPTDAIHTLPRPISSLASRLRGTSSPHVVLRSLSSTTTSSSFGDGTTTSIRKHQRIPVEHCATDEMFQRWLSTCFGTKYTLSDDAKPTTIPTEMSAARGTRAMPPHTAALGISSSDAAITSTRLRRQWRQALLQRLPSLAATPATIATTENITEQDQLTRAATLICACVDLKYRAEVMDAAHPIVMPAPHSSMMNIAMGSDAAPNVPMSETTATSWYDALSHHLVLTAPPPAVAAAASPTASPQANGIMGTPTHQQQANNNSPSASVASQPLPPPASGAPPPPLNKPGTPPGQHGSTRMTPLPSSMKASVIAAAMQPPPSLGGTLNGSMANATQHSSSALSSLHNTISVVLQPPAPPSLKLTYREGMRHIGVSYGGKFFAVEVIEPQGRRLVSSEIRDRLVAVKEMMQPTSSQATLIRVQDSADPDGRLRGMTALPLRELANLSTELRGACYANEEAFNKLDSCLFFVTLSSDASDTGEGAPAWGSFCNPLDAYWLGTGVSIVVHPNGNATFRVLSMVSSPAATAEALSWITTAASSDPVLGPPPAPGATSVLGVRRTPLPAVAARPNAATPATVGSPKQAPKAAKDAAALAAAAQAAALAEATPTFAQVVIPPPPSVAPPQPLPLWLPATRAASLLQGPQYSSQVNGPHNTTADITVQCGNVYLLHLAVVCAQRFAMESLDAGHVYSSVYVPTACEPHIRLCHGPEILSCLRRLQMTGGAGALRTETRNATEAAIAALQRIEAASPPHVSTFLGAAMMGIPIGQSREESARIYTEMMQRRGILVTCCPIGSCTSCISSLIEHEAQSLAMPSCDMVVSYAVMPRRRLPTAGLSKPTTPIEMTVMFTAPSEVESRRLCQATTKFVAMLDELIVSRPKTVQSAHHLDRFSSVPPLMVQKNAAAQQQVRAPLFIA